MRKVLIIWIAAVFDLGITSPAMAQSQKTKSASIEKGITGSWEVWIPGAVTYTAKENAVYQKYIPGAAMNRLEIRSDGSYQWGNQKGRLIEVRPWHAQEGRRYYRISDLKGNEYDFWYDTSKNQLTVLFGEVGGHAATGTRFNGNSSHQAGSAPKNNSSVKESKPAVTEASKNASVKTAGVNTFKPGAKVEIEWKGQWYKGTILEAGKNTFKVNYDGWGSLYDEWVTLSRIRRIK